MDSTGSARRANGKKKKRKNKKAKKESPRKEPAPVKSLDDLRKRDPDIDKVISYLSATSLFDTNGQEVSEIRVQLSDLDSFLRVGISCNFCLKIMTKWEKMKRRFSTFEEFVLALHTERGALETRGVTEEEYEPAEAQESGDTDQTTLAELKNADPHVDQVIGALSTCHLFDEVKTSKIEVGIKELVDLLTAGKGGRNVLIIIDRLERDSRRFPSFQHFVEIVITDGKSIRKSARAAKRRAKENESRVVSQEQQKVQDMQQLMLQKKQPAPRRSDNTHAPSFPSFARDSNACPTSFPALSSARQAIPSGGGSKAKGYNTAR